MTRRVVLPHWFGWLVLSGLAPLCAQPFGTDLIVGETAGPLYRVAPNGSFTTIGRYAASSITLSDVTIDADDRNVIVTTTRPAPWITYLLSVDLATSAPTPFATVSGSLTNLDENGDFIVSSETNTQARILRVGRSGTITTMLAQGLGTGTWLATRDVTTGNWLFATNRLDVLEYDPASASVVRTMKGPVSLPWTFVAHPGAPYVYLMTDRIWRLDTRTSAVATLAATFPAWTGGAALAIDRDAGTFGARIYATSANSPQDVIRAVDLQGNIVGSIGPFPGKIGGITFDRSRNLAPVLNRAPNDRFLLVSFANAVGLRYAVVLGFSGCWPGVGLRDGRRIGLTPDALTVLSAQGPIPPYLANNVGTLGPTGRAVATLNLNRLGPSARGVRLWAVAIVFDPSAPLGVAQISSPVVIVL